MNVLIFGATGPTGQELVKQALKKGHKITILARTPGKIALYNDKINIIKGDVLNYDDVEKAMKGQDVVLSALGVKPPSREKVVGPGMKNIIKAMNKYNVKRLIVQSAFFMDEKVKKNLFVKFLISTFMKGLYEDKSVQNKALKASSLNWTEVRPTMLTNGNKSKYKIDVSPGMFSKISRANVADFMLEQISDTAFLQKPVIITQ